MKELLVVVLRVVQRLLEPALALSLCTNDGSLVEGAESEPPESESRAKDFTYTNVECIILEDINYC